MKKIVLLLLPLIFTMISACVSYDPDYYEKTLTEEDREELRLERREAARKRRLKERKEKSTQFEEYEEPEEQPRIRRRFSSTEKKYYVGFNLGQAKVEDLCDGVSSSVN